MRSRQRVLVSPQKFWSQSQVGLSNRQGTWIQGLCFKLVTHWKLLTSGVFSFNLKGKCTVQGPILKEWESNPQLPPHIPNTCTATKAPSGRQTPFGNEAPPEAQGVNSCTEGCVLWSQHLRRWEGWWAEKEGVSGPDSEGRSRQNRLHLESRTPSWAGLWTLSYTPSIYGNNIPTGKPDPTPYGRAPGFLPRLSVA